MHCRARIVISYVWLRSRRGLPLKGLSAVVVACVVLWGGSAGGDDPADDEAAGVGVALDVLVMVRDHEKDPATEDASRATFRLYDRRTDDEVNLGQFHFGGYFGQAHAVSLAFREGLAGASREDRGEFGYVDLFGNDVISFQYAHTDPFRDGLAKVLVGGDGAPYKWGFINRENEWMIPPGRYDDLGDFQEGRCAFRVGEKWGLLDARGKVVVEPRFERAPVFHQGLAAIDAADAHTLFPERPDEPPVYIDRFGRVLLKAPADAVWAGDFHDGVAWFGAVQAAEGSDPLDEIFWENHVRYGLMSMSGNVILPPTYREVGTFSEGLAEVSLDADVSVEDDEPMEAAFRDPFDDTDKGSWGYVSTTGQVAIPLRFKRIGQFSGGLARAREDEKWGYIDHAGKWAIEPQYDWALDFRDGLALVWLDERVVLINRAGTIVIETGLQATTF